MGNGLSGWQVGTGRPGQEWVVGAVVGGRDQSAGTGQDFLGLGSQRGEGRTG